MKAKKILWIDDEIDLLKAHMMFLEEKGYEVTGASSGGDAVAIIRKEQFDLILLGMGSEGHTASLFPNSYAAFDTEHLACVVYVMDEKLNRITLTHRVLRAASHLIVLACGQEKEAILKTVLTSEPDEVRYPIHVLWPVLDRVTWLLDSAAAKAL